MFSHHFDESPGNRVVFHWFMLSFNGGFINAGGFLATGKFVSHVTGFATLFGVDLSKSDFQGALGILSVPLFFLLGAFIAGLLIERPVYQMKAPHFDWVMGLCAFFLFSVAIAGQLFLFGQFNETLAFGKSYTLLALLCLASGLQNGAITASSNRSVRTTHLTGLTTDLGIGLSRVLTFDISNPKAKKEIRANYLRFGSICSFIVGSAVGAWIFIKYGYRGFIIPGFIATYASWHGARAKTDHDWQRIKKSENTVK